MPFTEIADRVWVARYPWLDVNVSVVGGDRGLVVVDTHSSARVAREVVADVRALRAGEVVAVVNTHEHFDHTFGNVTFREEYGDALPIHATDEAAERTVSAGERIKRTYADAADDPHRDEVLETPIVPADHVFSSASVIDLGDRGVELVHPGRGHTGGDLVVRVPDADALLAGDLVEESAPPAYGADSFPMDWPLTLHLVLNLTTPGTVIVPGHGALVDRAFVQDQRADIGVVAETIRDLAGRGVPVDEALAAADWPFPREGLADAVRRGYAQLPRAQKRLPLI
ncbi:MBL fold metallo-hydrolase [Nocardioides immobilis]|uniref:MBL fold metallo-hydrolase n=1 Tax=Nocardioides immobilis TaxID=2049295 RepID=A0A417XVN0_9ACTN|nr:MBL fold metallo-hydrolase [Nocardioides immobilis]RHW24558.1 MBL fold metallo-hydrolase [Nocardioides immobilis]